MHRSEVDRIRWGWRYASLAVAGVLVATGFAFAAAGAARNLPYPSPPEVTTTAAGPVGSGLR